jgi:ABC-type phosphate/phosphonate transport system substrate-binding protein
MHAPFVPYVSPALATGTDTGKLVAAVCFLILAATGRVLVGSPPASAAESELTIVVMDPLAVPLSCACVKGYAQRKYDRLGEYLEQKLHRKVRVSYSEDLARALPVVAGQRVDLIIGKQSVVDSDAARCRLVVRPVARLTDRKGLTTLTGLFVVRTQDPARQLADLKGYTFFFGPADSAEKHSAAVAALRQAGVAVPEPREVCPGCSDAAFKVLEFKDKPGAAGVISCYAMALLEGCGTIDKGSLRVIGQTQPVPFVTAFVTERVPAATRDEIVEALVSARDHAALLEAIESKEGFVRLEAAPSASAAPRSSPSAASPSWPGWRGAGRDGLAAWLPSKFSADTKILWHKPLSGPGLSGIAATGQEVIVADRDADDQCDIFRCLAADNGAQLWELRYPAAGALDYGNSPRATPLIHDGKVYLLGAFGDLHCVNLADGKCLWKKNFIHEFRAKPPKWGLSASPLLVGDKLIVNPGAKDASLVPRSSVTDSTCATGPASIAWPWRLPDLRHLVPMLGEIGLGLFLHGELLCETVLTGPTVARPEFPVRR